MEPIASARVGSQNPKIVERGSVHMQVQAHEKALALLDAELAQLTKQLETLKAERQVLEAVARKLAKNRRSN